MSEGRLVPCPGCGQRIPVPREAKDGDLIDCPNCAGVKFRLLEGPGGDALRTVQMVPCPACGERIPVDDDTPEGAVIEHDGVAFRLVRAFGAFSLERAGAGAS